MSKKFTVAFATLSITAESIEEALQKAKTEARVTWITDDEALGPSEVRVVANSVNASGSTRPEPTAPENASESTRPEPTAPENEFAAAGFHKGNSYYSETETWIGTIGNPLGNGTVSVLVQNLHNGHTETREFRLTDNKNLRSTRGSIVLYANKPANA